MKLPVIALSFFLTAAGLCAQAVMPSGGASFGIVGPFTADSSASAAVPWSSVSGCPVALRATQISSGNMMKVRKGQPQQWGQRLHLIFASHETKQITAATVKVSGFSFRPRITNAANIVLKQGADGTGFVTRELHIAFGPQAGESLAADILVPDVSATQTIELVALTYADGTSWKLAAGQTCRITPDPLMLISAGSR